MTPTARLSLVTPAATHRWVEWLVAIVVVVAAAMSAWAANPPAPGTRSSAAATRPAGAAPAANVGGAQPAVSPTPSPSSKGAAALRRATEAFVGRLPERVDQILKLTEDADLAELKRVVHQLKGVGTGFGFARLTELAARAEQTLKAEAALDRVRADVDELVGMIRGIDGYDQDRGGSRAGATDARPTEAAHRG